MAFQSDTSFAGFLSTTARSVALAESAPAMNFLLEERLPALREQTFLNEKSGHAPAGWDVISWWEAFGNHYSDRVARPLRRAPEVSTFADENSDNHLAIESHQDVVRLESLKALHQRFPGDFDSPADLAVELRNLVRSRQPGQAGTFSVDQRSRLDSWVNELNHRRDAVRPMQHRSTKQSGYWQFPTGRLELRNVLGLTHFAGSATNRSPSLCAATISPAWSALRGKPELQLGQQFQLSSKPVALRPALPSSHSRKQLLTPTHLDSESRSDLSEDGGLDFKSELIDSASTTNWTTSPWSAKSKTRSQRRPTSRPPGSDISACWSRTCSIVLTCRNHERSPPTLARRFACEPDTALDRLMRGVVPSGGASQLSVGEILDPLFEPGDAALDTAAAGWLEKRILGSVPENASLHRWVSGRRGVLPRHRGDGTSADGRDSSSPAQTPPPSAAWLL